jgi:hypothetical protein
MERDEEKKQEQPKQTITAYIGLQNEPLGEEPNISISFQISLRLFCVAFAISRMEKDNDDYNRSDF